MKRYDLVILLGSQVMYADGQYRLALHTAMRTEAAAIALQTGIAKNLIISGGSNFGVRYNDQQLLLSPDFSFPAFADADFRRKSEAAAIKDVLVTHYGVESSRIFTETNSATTEENAAFLNIILKRRPMFTGNESVAILTLFYHMERALPIFRDAGINVEPLFAENVLAGHDITWVGEIREYYSTPKGGKQYDSNHIGNLLFEGKSLEELLSRWWCLTVIGSNICADGRPEDLEKPTTHYLQAHNLQEATEKFRAQHSCLPADLGKFIKGPFESLELAYKALA